MLLNSRVKKGFLKGVTPTFKIAFSHTVVCFVYRSWCFSPSSYKTSELIVFSAIGGTHWVTSGTKKSPSDTDSIDGASWRWTMGSRKADGPTGHAYQRLCHQSCRYQILYEILMYDKRFSQYLHCHEHDRRNRSVSFYHQHKLDWRILVGLFTIYKSLLIGYEDFIVGN